MSSPSITRLVSSIPQSAKYLDDRLRNPWGIVIDPLDDTVWIANNATDSLSHYTQDGKATFVTPFVNVTSDAPTGLVVNEDPFAFQITNGPSTAASRLITVTETGFVDGYNAAVDPNNTIPVPLVPPPANPIYKGVAILREAGQSFLFIADWGDRLVLKVDSKWNVVWSGTDAGLDAAGYAPFNVYVHKGKVYVSYAKFQTLQPALVSGSAPKPTSAPLIAIDDVPGIGNGYIDILVPSPCPVTPPPAPTPLALPAPALSYTFLRFADRGALNSPWGMQVINQILFVGNFGDGKINLFELDSQRWLGPLRDSQNLLIQIDGLWGLLLKPKEKKCCSRDIPAADDDDIAPSVEGQTQRQEKPRDSGCHSSDDEDTDEESSCDEDRKSGRKHCAPKAAQGCHDPDSDGVARDLFFTAGINDQDDGLFGFIHLRDLPCVE